MPTVAEWLEKATFTTEDLKAPGGGWLSPQQARQFLRVAVESSELLKEARYRDSDSASFEEPRLAFNDRILRRGTEAVRLADTDRAKPTTGLMTLETKLLRGEVHISDEVFEDNIEKDQLADTIMQMIAEAVGRDLEELAIKGDTARTPTEDQYLDVLDGLIKQAQTLTPAAQRFDASGAMRYDDLFHEMVARLPDKFRRDYTQLRLYLPVIHRDGYQRALAARGTGLGDQAVVANLQVSLAFRGIRVVSVPLLSGTDTISNAAVDYSQFALLTTPSNIVQGYHRRVRVEKFRDPREGATSFVVTVRADFKFAIPEMVVLAYNVPATLN